MSFRDRIIKIGANNEPAYRQILFNYRELVIFHLMESGITQREIGMLFNIGATRVKQINEKTKNKMRVIEDISDIKWLLSRTK